MAWVATTRLTRGNGGRDRLGDATFAAIVRLTTDLRVSVGMRCIDMWALQQTTARSVALRACSIAFCIITVRAAQADACTYPSPGPACQNAFDVDAVFLGTATNITPMGATPTPTFPHVVVTFSLERAFRGVENATMAVRTGNGGGDCGYRFKAGERYLVYAYRQKDGTLTTGISTRTRLASQAKEDLEFLSHLASPSQSGHVFGVVKTSMRDLAFGQSRRSPAPFVHVLLRGSAGGRDAETDAEGRYDISGVPPGRYELQLIPPAVFSSEYLTRTIAISDPRGCASADFDVMYNGSVSGVLLTVDGNPANDVQVELISGEALWISQTLTTKTNRSGEFQFKNLSPGRYGVGVSLRRTVEPPVLYPKTLYPGTPSESYAAILELGEGAHLQLESLGLQPARPNRELTGTVAWPDGLPGAGASVMLVDETGQRGVSASIAKTDAAGRFTLLVHEGMTYRVRAHFSLKTDAGYQQFDALDEAFVASPQLPSPRLVLTPMPSR